jgi:type IV pilus assembly protein PilA
MKTRNVVLLAILGTALFLFIPGVIVVAVVVPKFAASRMGALEVSAIREIRAIQSAQVQYFSQYGKYSTTLAELGPPGSGATGPQAADLISRSLASGENNGYVFTLAATPTGYSINANPKVYHSTGRRTFYSDQTLEIHQNWSQEPASPSSPELK